MSGTSSSTAFRPPHERGNSSYQALKRALTRSTSSGIGLSSVVAPSRSCGLLHRRGRAPAPSATSNFCVHRRVGVESTPMRVLDRVLRGRPWRFSSARSSKTTPSESSPERSSSRSASTLRRSSSCQVAQRSVQASKLNCQVPGVSTVNSPAQRTPLMCASTACSSDSSQRRPPGRLVLDDGLQLLVAVAEDVGGNGDGVAYGALDCVPPVVEDRRRLCDSDPARTFTALRCGHLGRGVSDKSIT